MKKIFIIDWIMFAAFVPTVCSGIGLHLAGHGTDHEAWHNWAAGHIAAGLLFLVATVWHIMSHWGWYKGILKRGAGRKSKITMALSVVFAVVVATGIVLLGVHGANTPLGLCHYKVGIGMSLLAVWHILKRIGILIKPIRRR